MGGLHELYVILVKNEYGELFDKIIYDKKKIG